MPLVQNQKTLLILWEKVLPFPPGPLLHQWQICVLSRYARSQRSSFRFIRYDCKNIHDKLIAGVDKRLDAMLRLVFY